jgi:hypothetical protein
VAVRGVHPRLGALLYEQIERTDAFQRRHGRNVPWVFWWGDGVQLGDFRKHLRKACKAAGCPGRRVHDLRRGAVRNLLRAGVSEHVAMRLTGWPQDAVHPRPLRHRERAGPPRCRRQAGASRGLKSLAILPHILPHAPIVLS